MIIQMPQKSEGFKPVFVEIKQVYGKPLMYPACEISKAACQLAGKETVTSAMLAPLKAMGFAVYQKPIAAREVA